MTNFTKFSSCLVLFVIYITICDAVMDKTLYRSLTSFRDCFGRKNAGVCLKERAFEALNETIMSDRPISFYNIIEIERNPKYKFSNNITDELPQDVSARSMKLTDILFDQVEEFFKSRTIKFNMDAAVEEGRGKKDKGKGGMMMIAMGGMACMMAQMFMGKIAFMAGSALILAKVALFMSAIIGLKKLSSGGGGGESHVVYASEGHGGGGWHRSLDSDAAHNLAYRAHTSAPTGY